jgi:hypothetical protein
MAGLRGVAAIPIRLAVRPPLIAVAAISLAAFAQTPAPVTLSGVFDPDLAEIRPDAMGKLQEAAKKANWGGCYPPRATFKALVPAAGVGEDPLFLSTLAEARGIALTAALPSLGLTRDQFKTIGTREGNSDNVLVTYDKFTPDDDKDPPTLKVTWVPKKGTKVKAGDKIKATIKASERYEDGHKSWPTGVYDIRLAAVHGGFEATVDFMDYGRPTQPCERRTFEATFTVPRNPLPIVHLKAIAEDGVRHPASEDGKFPTVEVWHGTWEHFIDVTSYDGVQYNRIKRDEVVTFDLYEASKDKLEGQAHATWTFSEEVTAGKCAGAKLIQDPGTVGWDAQLTGSIQRLPGITRFDFHATPDRGRPYKVINTPGGECTTGGTYQWNDNKWSGTNFDLKSDQDHYDESRNIPPLTANETGKEYYKFHVESSGK